MTRGQQKKVAEHFENARLIVTRAEDRLRNRVAHAERGRDRDLPAGEVVAAAALEVIVSEATAVVLEMNKIIGVLLER